MAPPCDPNISKSIETQWMNYSSHWNDSEFQDYICKFLDFYWHKEKHIVFETYVYLIFGLIGLISALLTLIIFSRKEFSIALGFLMYKVIAGLELINSLFTIVDGTDLFYECPPWYVCMFMEAHVTYFVRNTCSGAVHSITLFICIERIVACLMPLHFHKIHKKSIFVIVIICAILVPAASNAPLTIFRKEVVFSQEADEYILANSAFAATKTFRDLSMANMIRYFLLGALITLATGISVWGLLKIRRLKKKVQSASSQDNILDMCYLQLCLAVPAIITYALATAQRLAGLDKAYVLGENVFEKSLSYAEAMVHIKMARQFYELKSAIALVNCISHAYHYYLYLIFCRIVRKSTLGALRQYKCIRKRVSNGPKVKVEQGITKDTSV